jgi:hypothetical protein
MSKKNLILGGILVVLIGLAFIYEGPLQNLRERFGKPNNFLTTLDATQVSRIDITRAGETISIEQEGERWKLAETRDFYIKDDIMATLMVTLKEATQAKVEIVSENPENKSDLETNVDTGALVSFRQADTVLMEVVVGKLASDFSSTYISQIDRNETYSVAANLRNALVRSDWYDKVIFESDKEAVNKIRFQYPTREFTIEKGEDGWSGTLPYSFKIDEEKIEPILDIMTDLSTADIPDQTFEGTGLEKNSIIVQATGEGIDNVLMIGDEQPREGEEEIEEGEKLYFAKDGSRDNIYLIDGNKKIELDKQISDLR